MFPDAPATGDLAVRTRYGAQDVPAAANEQGVPLIHLTPSDLARLDTLGVSSVAKARIGDIYKAIAPSEYKRGYADQLNSMFEAFKARVNDTPVAPDLQGLVGCSRRAERSNPSASPRASRRGWSR